MSACRMVRWPAMLPAVCLGGRGASYWPAFLRGGRRLEAGVWMALLSAIATRRHLTGGAAEQGRTI